MSVISENYQNYEIIPSSTPKVMTALTFAFGVITAIGFCLAMFGQSSTAMNLAGAFIGGGFLTTFSFAILTKVSADQEENMVNAIQEIWESQISKEVNDSNKWTGETFSRDYEVTITNDDSSYSIICTATVKGDKVILEH